MIVSDFSKKNKDYFLKHNNIKYGKFMVLSMDSVTNKGNLMVSALCDCGVEYKVCLALIVSGRLKSCKECQKIVRGVGINDADYNVAVTVDGVKRYCPYYRTWSNLLSRCYSEKFSLSIQLIGTAPSVKSGYASRILKFGWRIKIGRVNTSIRIYL